MTGPIWKSCRSCWTQASLKRRSYSASIRRTNANTLRLPSLEDRNAVSQVSTRGESSRSSSMQGFLPMYPGGASYATPDIHLSISLFAFAACAGGYDESQLLCRDQWER